MIYELLAITVKLKPLIDSPAAKSILGGQQRSS